ncbi:hypothetical protein SSS_00101 [Sarcoptes scabiei]|nr:hypothetical protein SSS_00101 [Sarcoptes scabiei]
MSKTRSSSQTSIVKNGPENRFHLAHHHQHNNNRNHKNHGHSHPSDHHHHGHNQSMMMDNSIDSAITSSSSTALTSKTTTMTTSSAKNSVLNGSKMRVSQRNEKKNSIVSNHQRKNRKNITLGMKLDIIRRLEQGQSNSSICHEFNLPSSTVSTIRSKKEQIKAFCKNSPVQNQYYQISYPRNNVIEQKQFVIVRFERRH